MSNTTDELAAAGAEIRRDPDLRMLGLAQGAPDQPTRRCGQPHVASQGEAGAREFRQRQREPPDTNSTTGCAERGSRLAVRVTRLRTALEGSRPLP